MSDHRKQPRGPQQSLLLKLVADGLTTDQVASKLGRTPTAITVWMYELRASGKTKLLIKQKDRWKNRTKWKLDHKPQSRKELLAKARARAKARRDKDREEELKWSRES